MSVATHEVRRSRLLVSLLAVCLVLAAILQLNGRSILAIGEAQGKTGAFAALVQPDPKGVAGGLARANGPISRLLDSARRSFDKPSASDAGATTSREPANTLAYIAPVALPASVPAELTGLGQDRTSERSIETPGFGGLLAQFSPLSGPSGILPSPTPTPQPTSTPPTGTPTPEPTVTPTPEPSATPPVTEPTPPVTEPTPPVTEPTPPVTEPTPPVTEPTPPVVNPTPPVSPVPEPAAWALWLLGFGVIGSLVRWRRRALDAAAAEGLSGDVA